MAAAMKEISDNTVVPLHTRRKLAFAYTKTCVHQRDGKHEVAFKKFKNSKASWEDIVTGMSKPARSMERQSEYQKWSKAQRLLSKAQAGAFLTGVCEEGSRAKGKVNKRDILCIDYDSKDAYQANVAWDAVKEIVDFGDIFGNPAADLSWIAHTTRSHVGDDSPRFRILVPLTRTVNPEEYAFLCRVVAQMLDEDMRGFDRTTTEANRVMFYPSVSKDQEYTFFENKGAWLDVDQVLDDRSDQFADLAQWPMSIEEVEVLDTFTKKEVKDPLTKEGEVGAFCRTYDIREAMEEFIPDVYEDGEGDRLTFVGGTSANGAQIFEDKWLYSHHSTDPAAGHMQNAFDLVRIHKFGDLDRQDKADDAVGTNTPSYKAMVALCRKDNRVRAELYIREDAAIEDMFDEEDDDVEYEAAEPEHTEYTAANDVDISDLFGDEPTVTTANKLPRQKGTYSKEQLCEMAKHPHKDWKNRIADTMEVNSQGKVLRSTHTIKAIMENSPKYRGMFVFDPFNNRLVVTRKVTDKPGTFNPEPMSDYHEVNIASEIFREYDWTGETISRNAISDCCTLVSIDHQYHPVQEYLRSLEWDGVKRAETFFVRHLKAPDNTYIKEATFKWMLAAVSRVFNPGAKFDNAIILEGHQGIGKSTLLQLLASNPEWFTDNVDMNAPPREIVETLSGKWIVEMGELDTVNRTTNERAKKFLSTQAYKARAAYAHNATEYRLQCVFTGSTNRDEYLTDDTGNRRYWPIPSSMKYGDFIDVKAAKAEVDQVWAEVMHTFASGDFTLALSRESVETSTTYQESRVLISDDDMVREAVEAYLNEPIDPDGDFQDEDNPNNEPQYRQRVSILELWTRALGNRTCDRVAPAKMSALGRIAGGTPGWRLVKKKTALVDDGTGSKRRLVYVERVLGPDIEQE